MVSSVLLIFIIINDGIG